MLKALDNLSVRRLEAINLVRSLLRVSSLLIPMSEHPVDLMAIDNHGERVYGEVQIDQLAELPQKLLLSPHVKATPEAVEAIEQADLLLIGPGSFLTSLMPLLLLEDLTQAIKRSIAYHIYIGNLGKELSPAAASLSLSAKVQMMEQAAGKQFIDAIILGPNGIIDQDMRPRHIIQQTLEARDIPYRHDRELLREAIEKALRQLNDAAFQQTDTEYAGGV